MSMAGRQSEQRSPWIAALPMYNVTPYLAAGWRELLAELGRRLAAGADAYASLEIASPDETNLTAFWSRDNLLLSQTCGYPLIQGLGKVVQVVATPVFDAPGCAGADYSSVIVTRKKKHSLELDAFRGRIAACNSTDSHSGMNALRHTFAPFARDGRVFKAVVHTGSHVNSLRALAGGHADVAAIDCITFAYVRDHLPKLLEGLRPIAFSRAAPGLPMIASRRVDADLLARIRDELDDIVTTRRALARRLRLLGFARLTLGSYRSIAELELESVAAGYPALH
jgi:ABC-type phosphate/phosphonate transport system substrate-binding protein